MFNFQPFFILSFISMLQFLVLSSDYSGYSKQDFVLEVQSFDFGRNTIISSHITNNEDYLFVLIQKPEEFNLLVFNIEDKEKTLTIINSIAFRHDFLPFIITPDDNYLIGVSGLDNESTIALQIYDISNKSNFQLCTNLTYEGSKPIKKLDCMDTNCDNILLIDNNLLFRSISIVNKTNATEKTLAIMESNETLSHIVLFPENNILVAQMNDSDGNLLKFYFLSNMSLIKIYTLPQPSLSTKYPFFDSSDDLLFWGACKKYAVSTQDIYYVNISKWSPNDSISELSSFLEIDMGCYFDEKKTIMWNDTFYYVSSFALFVQIRLSTLSELYFNKLDLVADLHLLRKTFDYMICIYNSSFGIFKKYNINPDDFQFSISDWNWDIPHSFDYLYHLESGDTNTFIAYSFKNTSYNILKSSNLNDLDISSEYSQFYRVVNPSFVTIIGCYSSAKNSSLFLMILKVAFRTTIDLYFSSFTNNVQDSYINLNVKDTVERAPRIDFISDNLYYLNLNLLSNLYLFNVETQKLKATNIVTNNYAAFCTCIYNNEWFVFVMDPTFLLNIYSINQKDPSIVTLLSQIFISLKFVSYIKASADCKFAYVGGSNLLIINLFNISSPTIDANVLISNVYWIDFLKNKIYVECELYFYIINVQNSTNPYMIYRSITKGTSFNKNNLIIESNGNHYIYIPRGDRYDAMIETTAFHLYILNKDEKPKVGIPFICYFVVLDLEFRVINSGNIEKIYLATLRAEQTPFLQATPSWITYDKSGKFLTMVIPKEYQNSNLSLLFSYTEGIYQQIVMFPLAESSLSYEIEALGGLKILSPSVINSQIQIQIHEPKHILIIDENFAGIFTSYSALTGSFIANGYISSLNSMLKKLRYTTIGNGAAGLDFIISDYVNYDLIAKNLSFSIFHRNQPPNCSRNLQDILNIYLESNQSIIIPFKKIEIQFEKEWFYDIENDTITFSFENTSKIEWLTFSVSDLSFSGTPQTINQADYSFNLVYSDGYDQMSQTISFTVYDDQPKVSKPIQKQLNDSIIKVGQNFDFTFNADTFIDPDYGPYNLSFSSIVYIGQESFDLSDSSEFWMKFDKLKRNFVGTPTNTYIEKNITFEVIANDGVKKVSDNFTLLVKNSLSLIESKENNNYFPNISTIYLNSSITAKVKNPNGQIIVLSSFMKNHENIQISNISFSEIQIKATTNNFNEIFNYFAFRDIPTDLNKNQRILAENEPENLTIHIVDEFNQSLAFNLSKSKFKNVTFPGKLINSLIKNEYSVEIDQPARFSIDKQLYAFPNTTMNLIYDFYMTNEDNKVILPWILLEEQNLTLQFYTSNNVDASFKGVSKLHLKITDEFNQTYEVISQIKVDYSLTYYVIEYLKLLGTASGSLVSFIATLLYFYLFYNFIWRNRYTKGEIVCEKTKITKLKIPLVGYEFNLALKIYSSIGKKGLEAIKNELVFGNFNSFLNKINDVNQKHPTITNIISNQQKETVSYLLEGIIIQSILQSSYHGKKLLSSFEKISKTRTKQENIFENDWILLYFLEVSEGSKNDQNVTDYMYSKGLYKKCEKNTIFNFDKFEETFEKTFHTYREKAKISETEKNKIKELLIRSIIAYKRGVPFDCDSIGFKIKNICKILPIKFFPIYYGSCLHLKWNDPIIIMGLQNSKIKQEKHSQNQVNKIGIKSYISSNINFIQIPISNLEVTTLDWLEVKIKNGCLVFRIDPKEHHDIHSVFMIRIQTNAKYILLQFTITIIQTDINKKAKENIYDTVSNIELMALSKQGKPTTLTLASSKTDLKLLIPPYEKKEYNIESKEIILDDNEKKK